MPRLGEVNESYPALLETENKIRLLEPFKGAKQHHKMQCLVCQHKWTATPVSKRQTLKKHGVTGCPKCNDARQGEKVEIIQDSALAKLKELGVTVLSEFTAMHNNMQRLTFYNSNCGHTFTTRSTRVFKLLTTCTICGKQDRVKPLTQWSKNNSAKWRESADAWSLYKSRVYELTRLTYKNNKRKINPRNYARAVAGTPNAYHLDHIVPIRFCFDNMIPPELCADSCNLHMLPWEANISKGKHLVGSLPRQFLPFITADSIAQYHTDVLMQAFPNANRLVPIHGTIATIYDDSTNRAIYVIPTTQQFANQKTAHAIVSALKSTDINFTILFDDELQQNADLVKKKLLHYTHSNNATRLHARQCTIRVVEDVKSIRALLEANHVQGFAASEVYVGAYHDGKLVAIMSFSHPRAGIGRYKDSAPTKWELVRFCTDTEYRIPGVASRLLKHFQQHYSWTEIYSYADKRWSVGNMYQQLGFQLTADNPPDYTYMIDGIRKHRWNYRKDILKKTLKNFDPKLTEYENMEAHGFWRVWDCGTLRYTLTKSECVSQM